MPRRLNQEGGNAPHIPNLSINAGDYQFHASRVFLLTEKSEGGLDNAAKTRNPLLAENRAPGHWFTGWATDIHMNLILNFSILFLILYICHIMKQYIPLWKWEKNYFGSLENVDTYDGFDVSKPKYYFVVYCCTSLVIQQTSLVQCLACNASF
jgi:hypothetical protein